MIAHNVARVLTLFVLLVTGAWLLGSAGVVRSEGAAGQRGRSDSQAPEKRRPPELTRSTAHVDPHSVLAPEIVVGPATLQSAQIEGTVVTHTLTISNTGAPEPLNWTIHEAPLAPLANVVTDGGFEGGTPNAAWNEYSSNFGTVLCHGDTCGIGSGTGPRSGDWWAWFGGTQFAEWGSVDQDLFIGEGTATLSFWLEIPYVGTTGWLSVFIDDDVLATFTEADAVDYATYQQVTLDVSAYGDGDVHNLAFESMTNAGTGSLNFFVDDVELDAVGYCDTVADISWLSVSPGAGTTAPGDSSDVAVVFDASDVASGVYEANLCINSDDPDSPEVRVPVEMTVMPRLIGVELGPDDAATAAPGATVTYTVQITNTGNVPDTFDLTVSGHSWNTALSTSSVTLAAGADASFVVTVNVPAAAGDGDSDGATVTATSQADGAVSDAVQLATTAQEEAMVWRIFVPMMWWRD